MPGRNYGSLIGPLAGQHGNTGWVVRVVVGCVADWEYKRLMWTTAGLKLSSVAFFCIRISIDFPSMRRLFHKFENTQATINTEGIEIVTFENLVKRFRSDLIK